MLQYNERLISAIFITFLVGCASQQKTDTAQTTPAAKSTAAKPAAATTPSTPGGRVVKSKDGTIEGEIVGTPAPKSKFSKLQIGMTPEQVEKLIGRPDDTDAHVTGKAFIPFHFGGDTQRLEYFYKREGQLSFANTNNFIAPNALIKIEVNAKATGISK